MISKIEVKITVAKDRNFIKLFWETKNGYYKEVTIPITEYWESRLR